MREPALESATTQSHAPAPAAATAPKKYDTLMGFFVFSDEILNPILMYT